MIPEELDDEPRNRVQDQIPADDLTCSMRAIEHPVQNREDDEVYAGFVELCRMQRHIERHWCGRIRVKGHGPGQVAGFTPAAAGGKTSHTPDGLPKHETGRKAIHREQRRQVLPAHVDYRQDQSRDQAAVKHTGCL